MEESSAGSAPNTLLLPAHGNLNGDDDDEQISDDHFRNKNKANSSQNMNNKPKSSSQNNTALTDNRSSTNGKMDVNDSYKHDNSNANNTETLLLTSHDDDNQRDTSPMMPSSTAPIAKIITIKTYRPAKIGAALITLIAIVLLFIAAMTSEWLGRYDLPESPRQQGTIAFYRYGIFEYCHGYIDRKIGSTYDVKCQVYPIVHKTWVQICAGMYGGTIFIAFAAFIVLCVALKLDTDNMSKWRLYKASVGLLLAAGFILASCLLLWSARFLFEVTMRQRLLDPSMSLEPTRSYLPTQATVFSPISFAPRKSTPALSANLKKATPSPDRFQFNGYPMPQQHRNITITGEMTRDLHARYWPQVMSSIICGWGFIVAWIAALLLFLPAVLLIVDGKKDEHVCEEQLVYPSSV